MAEPNDTSPILLRDPFTLLYWMVFRALALRRYAQSIHADLDEDLNVWRVCGKVGNDPRFRALCWARWGLLSGAPCCAVLLVGSLCLLFDVGFGWRKALLWGASYTAGILLSEALVWQYPDAERWANRWIWFLGAWSVGVALLARFFPSLKSFGPLALLAVVSPFTDFSVVVFGVAGGVAVGVVVGVAVGVAVILVFLRLPLYLLWELPRCFHLSGQALRQPEQAVSLWHKQPLHYDEMIQLPLLGLEEHLAAIAEIDPGACLEALADVGASLRQQWASPRALRLILAAELCRCTTPALLERFHEATAWLPTDLLAADEREFLIELRSISADTAGALVGMTRAARQQGLHTQITRLQARRLQLGRSDRARMRGYAEPLAQWQGVLEAEVNRLGQERTLIGELPMRYSAGAVLEPGARAFQGRADLFYALENLLINAPSKTTPLLLGQPRTGKSSALKQLPLRLGAQVLSVYLDMERRSTAMDASGLFSDVVGEIRAAALRHPQPVSLPGLDDALLRSDPYRVFENWLEDVEGVLGEGRWLLLTLDEFDRIDQAVRSERLDERVFFLFRSLIQHHPRIALALSGTFPLAECDPRWYEALKSAQMLPVSYLRPEDARQVLTRPAPDFPDNVYSEAAIVRALHLTGGQPYLVHLLGATVINTYNRQRADLPPGTPPGTPLPVQAIDDAIPGVMESGELALMSIWQWVVKIGQAHEIIPPLLRALAHGQPGDTIGDPEQRMELLELFCERDLLAQDDHGDYHFRVPLIAHWIRAQRRLPRLL